MVQSHPVETTIQDLFFNQDHFLPADRVHRLAVLMDFLSFFFAFFWQDSDRLSLFSLTINVKDTHEL